ncbi:MAG: Sir2 family NAD-dependent protein deacetylase [Amphritea sp.]
MVAESIVILTGAEISAEPGIQTFRAADGLWENHRIEGVATPQAYMRDPALVHNFYNARREKLLQPDISPYPAHQALAELEQNFTGKLLLVTQNIDNLHERAGNKKLIHMHGELLNIRCTLSGEVFKTRQQVLTDTRCNCCKKNGHSTSPAVSG